MRDESEAIAFSSPVYGGPSLCGATLEPVPAAPSYVDGKLVAQARAENARLAALVGAPAAFRAGEIAAWAPAHRDDSDLAEDLHLAVNGTRHACGDGSALTAASKRAFKVLHKLLPSSPWTQKTKYWYP